MSFQFTLAKVLSVKENEKNQSEIDYRKAFEAFEKVAQLLHEFLNQKEVLQQKQQDGLLKGTSIVGIRQLQNEMEGLQKKIDHFEELYFQAREVTEQKKNTLLEQSIDVKRYEKLKENEYGVYLKKNKAVEKSQLDEISTIRHLQQ
ncbi:MAG TPA: flagellar export protein FliJ [Bacillales bacterium]|nr:flagellar export protein FliJ [Bacillales bacterium]